MQLLIKFILPRKNKNKLHKVTSDGEKGRITYKSPVSIKQQKLNWQVKSGKVCFIITSQNEIWFKIYMELAVTLVVTIYLATNIEILDLKKRNTEHRYLSMALYSRK